MGFFDSKSRQLRRKIKDLRAELIQAEKQGKFIMEDGIFFAELDDMGDRTMLIFSGGDIDADNEISVVQTFLERNGFFLEYLKMDRAGAHIAGIEIMPPAELMIETAKLLAKQGFNIIDDDEKEELFDPTNRAYPLSSLARALSLLFAGKVLHIVSTTQIKLTKEGNRLLSWMPMIIRALSQKVHRKAVEDAGAAFDEIYAHFYGHAEVPAPEMDDYFNEEQPSASLNRWNGDAGVDDDPLPIMPTITPLPSAAIRPADETMIAPLAVSAEVLRKQLIGELLQETKKSFDSAFGFLSSQLAGKLETRLTRLMQTGDQPPPPNNGEQERQQQQISYLTYSDNGARTRAAMYRTLVKARPAQAVRNAEILLQLLNKFFDASATCVMTRTAQGTTMTIFAQSGKQLVWGEGGGKGFPISASIVKRCARKHAAVRSKLEAVDPSQSMIRYNIESAVAAPIIINNELQGIIYVDRRENPTLLTDDDCRMLAQFAEIFQEFPDLTMGME